VFHNATAAGLGGAKVAHTAPVHPVPGGNPTTPETLFLFACLWKPIILLSLYPQVREIRNSAWLENELT
jgi:hypothetical protein